MTEVGTFEVWPPEPGHDEDECASCSTKKKNHGSIRHRFTLTPGELLEKKPKPKQMPDMANASMARLITTLVDKDILNTEDVLHIVGFKERDSHTAERRSTADLQRFADPARLF